MWCFDIKKAERFDYCGAYIEQIQKPEVQNLEMRNSAKQAKIVIAIVLSFVVLGTFFIVLLTVTSTALIAKHGAKNASFSGEIHIGRDQDIASMEELRDNLEQYAIIDEVEKTSFILEECKW